MRTVAGVAVGAAVGAGVAVAAAGLVVAAGAVVAAAVGAVGLGAAPQAVIRANNNGMTAYRRTLTTVLLRRGRSPHATQMRAAKLPDYAPATAQDDSASQVSVALSAIGSEMK